MKRGVTGQLKASRPAAQQAQGDSDVVHLPEYLLLDEVARICRFDVTAPSRPSAAAWEWLRREAVPVLRRGRTLLVERRVLDAVLRGV